MCNRSLSAEEEGVVEVAEPEPARHTEEAGAVSTSWREVAISTALSPVCRIIQD